MSNSWLDSIDILIIEDILGVKFLIKPLLLEDINLNQKQIEDFYCKKASFDIGYPLEYLLKYNYIDGLILKLDNTVLIPRPDTYQWVKLVIESNIIKKDDVLIDIGSGSGYITLLLAQSLNNPIYVNEISKNAVNVIKSNLELNKIKNKTRVFEGDIVIEYKNIVNEIKDNFIIFANLPYLPIGDIDKVNKIKYEPKEALFSGEDGLYLFNKLIEEIRNLQKKPRICFFELDPRNINQAIETATTIFKYSLIVEIDGFKRLLILSMDKIQLNH